MAVALPPPLPPCLARAREYIPFDQEYSRLYSTLIRMLGVGHLLKSVCALLLIMYVSLSTF
jgi:hypothetical protein